MESVVIVELNKKEQRKIYNYFREYDYFDFPAELEMVLSDYKSNEFSKFIKRDIKITVNYNSKKKIVFYHVSNSGKTTYEAKRFLQLYSKIWEIIQKSMKTDYKSETEYLIY